MNVLELLQIELWSKRTSRKILIVSGIVAALVLVAYGAGYGIEIHWLTRGEREAARAALQQIDALHDARSLSDEEFEALERQAEAKVKTAEDAATTLRDDDVAMDLSAYLISVTYEPAMRQDRHIIDQSGLPDNRNRKLEERTSALMTDQRIHLRSVLHQILD